jgi:hypothetical protein
MGESWIIVRPTPPTQYAMHIGCKSNEPISRHSCVKASSDAAAGGSSKVGTMEMMFEMAQLEQ